MLTLDLTTNQLPKPTSTLLLTITSFILTELWTARNKFKFDRIIPNHQRSTKTINTHITYMLTTHYKHHNVRYIIGNNIDRVRYIIGNNIDNVRYIIGNNIDNGRYIIGNNIALRKKNMAKFLHLEIFDCGRMRFI